MPKRRFPCLIYGVVIMTLIILWGIWNPPYDSGIIGLFYHFVLIPVLGFMFWLPHEIMFSLNSGRAFPGQATLAFAIGILLCLCVDLMLQKRKKHSHNQQVERTS